MPANVQTMFSGRGEVPWHKLGTIVQGVLTSRDAIAAAGLGWGVVKHPIFARIPDAPGSEHGRFKRVDSMFATVRDDTNRPLGVVGPQYVPITNESLFSCLDDLRAASGGVATYETAGALGDGERVWMLMVAGEDIRIAGDDIRPYILCSASHDGSSAVRIRPCTTRVVCANTLALAMGEKVAREVAIRHTASAEARMREAARALGIIAESHRVFAVTADSLLRATFTRSEMEALCVQLLGTPGADASKREKTNHETRFEALMQTAWGATDLNDIRFTRWGALNAVADFEQHGIRSKGDDKARLETAFTRATTTGPMTARAFQLLTGTN